MKKNVASQIVGAQLVSATDGSNVTSGTTTVYVTIDGGTQATGTVGSGAATHEGNGYWTYAPSQAETNGDLVAFTFVNSSAVSQTVQVYTSFPQTGDSYARLGAPAGASVSADVAAVKSDSAAILLDTGTDGVVVAAASKTGYSLTATTGLGNQTANITGNLSGSVGSVTGAVSADVTKISGSATAADNLEASALGIISGTAATGTLSTTVMTSDLSGYADDELIGRVVVWTGGTAAGQASAITDYASTSGTVTYDAITTAPDNGDTFVIV